MNEKFKTNELIHGTRYTVCVHADRKLIERETWIEELAAINACSDGIIVDLTPPTKGRLWIGTNPGISYQVIFLNKSNLLCYLLVVKMFNVHLKKVRGRS
jgi:hypothetical protein